MAINDCRPLPILTKSDIFRFWSKVDKRGPKECWPWKGGRSKRGYGKFTVQHRITLISSRICYAITNGSDPYPLLVCHSCDNPPCCNPKHLFKGTHFDNHTDSVKKFRDFCGEGERHGSRTHPEKFKAAWLVKWNGVFRHELHGMAKLTSNRVKKIRLLYKTGKYTQSALAKMFGVGQQQISRIVNYYRWS